MKCQIDIEIDDFEDPDIHFDDDEEVDIDNLIQRKLRKWRIYKFIIQ